MDNTPLGNNERSYISDILALPLIVRDAFITSMIISMMAIVIHKEISSAAVLLVITIGIGYTLGFAVNDFFDRDYDKFDNLKIHKNYFVNHSNSLGVVVLFGSVLIVSIASLSYSEKGVLVLLVAVFGFWSYSAKPLRFKSRPGYDLITHGLFIETFPYLITLYLLHIRFETIDFFLVFILLTNSIINQIRQQIRDYEIDIMVETNFTISIGLHHAASLSRLLNLLMIVTVLIGAPWILDYPILLPILILAMPFFFVRFVYGFGPSYQILSTKNDKFYKLMLITIFLYLAGTLTIGVL